MSRRAASRLGPTAACLAVAGLLVSAGAAAGQRIEPAPVPGPAGLSVGNEARMALIRAERWLDAHGAGADGDTLPPETGPEEDGEVERLQPLLDGDFRCLREGENVYEAWNRLAAGLSRRGLGTVYGNGLPVPWRNAVLHALVVSQRPDGMGGGWWGDGEEDAQRSTRAACATLRLLLGPGTAEE